MKDTNFHKWGADELRELVTLSEATRNFQEIADVLNAKYNNQRTGSACKTKVAFLKKKK